VQSGPSQFRHDEAVTEPSGHGPFAEAMRELIAQLPAGFCSCARARTSTPRLRLVHGAAAHVAGLEARSASGGRRRAHLRLVR
jgi:hypothetical protein